MQKGLLLNTETYSNTNKTIPTEDNDPILPRRKVGRPRKSPDAGTCAVAVTITKQQRKWLDQVTNQDVDYSMSKIVREALDLWKAVNLDGKAVQPRQEPDDYDYSWR